MDPLILAVYCMKVVIQCSEYGPRYSCFSQHLLSSLDSVHRSSWRRGWSNGLMDILQGTSIWTGIASAVVAQTRRNLNMESSSEIEQLETSCHNQFFKLFKNTLLFVNVVKTTFDVLDVVDFVMVMFFCMFYSIQLLHSGGF